MTIFSMLLLFVSSVAANEQVMPEKTISELRQEEQVPQVVIDEIKAEEIVNAPVVVPFEVSTTAPVYNIPAKPFGQSIATASANVMNDLTTSKFFIEFKPLRFQYANLSAETDMLIDGYKVFDENINKVKLKMLPLDFIFGFENKKWGSFADIQIDESSQHSEFAVYSVLDFSHIGFGISLDFENTTSRVITLGEVTKDESSESMEISPYFYLALKLADNEFSEFKFWNKIGAIYSRETFGSTEISALGFTLRSGMDIMFKTNKNLQVGLGLEFELLALRMGVDAISDSDSSALGIGLELNLFKMKYIF